MIQIIKDLVKKYNITKKIMQSDNPNLNIKQDLESKEAQIHSKPSLNEEQIHENEELQSNESDHEQVQQKSNLQDSATIKCITDPYQYLDYCLNNKKIKIMDEQNPIFPNVYLKDISLHYKGPMEDKAYSKNYLYYINVRRGNTLCQIYNQKAGNKDNFDLFFCRRGMKKFYDLEKEYLATGWENKLTTQHLKYRRRIFQKIDNVNYQQTQIHLYSIFKENGEHCQITYVKKLSCWLFASKNVSILVRDQKDLQNYYEKLRFYWAKLIAKQFLNMLKQLNQQQINELKEQLDTKTLLGEHCGNEVHQHITKYDKVQIIFYGIVQKDGQDHCLPVDYCKEFLHKYNFKMSKMKQVRNLKDKNSVYQNIYNLLKQTAQGTMDEYGEGSVLYVVQENKSSQRTIAMCKLKTCEYLIFRRLREMLKLNVQRKSTANTFEKFKFDIQNLITHYFKPPKSLEFYLKVGKEAFKQASKDTNVTETYLRYKFVEFMQKVEQSSKIQQEIEGERGKLDKKVLVVCLPRFTNKLEKYAKNNSIPLQYMYRNLPQNPKKQQTIRGSIHILHMIPRLPQDAVSLSGLQIFIYDYSPKEIQSVEQQLKSSKDLTKSHLITFIKSEDKRKSIQLLNQKIKSFSETLKSKNIKFTIVSKDIQDKDEQVINCLQKLRQTKKQTKSNQLEQTVQQNKIQQKDLKTHKKLLILYPMLLPGSGKSTLRQQLQIVCKKNKTVFHKIDADQIRSRCMQKNLETKGTKLNLELMEFNQTFAEVKQQAFDEYWNQVIQKIETHKNTSQENEILFVDKIFGPQIIRADFQRISKYSNVVPILLVPQSAQMKLKCFSLPFSLQYLLICLKRCMQREQHLTMTRLPEQICNTFLWFLKNYSNCSFRKLHMILSKVNPHTQMIKVQTINQKQVPIHLNLKKKLEESIESNGNKNKMIELIEEMYKNNEDYLKDIYAQNQKNDAADKLFSALKKIASNH